MAKTTSTKAAGSRAATAGRADGLVRATIKPHDYDPTGGFIKRTELVEDERREYVDAYDAEFRRVVKADREFAALRRGAL
jgi:hypothetical protein